MKTKGEHNCNTCDCISNVTISKKAYALASLVCVVSLLIVVLYSMAGNHGSFLGIAAVLMPFLIFYILVPFFVRLTPCKDQSAVKKLLDRNASDRPSDAAYQAAANSAAKPVMLDVEEDFSQKFMQAKHQNSLRSLEENDEENEPVTDQEPEDIQNTKIAFEINENTLYQEEEADEEGVKQTAAYSEE